MSASAGKVMPRPMGDYNALTEYKILDIVTYNDRPYIAKQTTTGNLPTNTTYWMLLLDFPTEVDDVPTQNSQNLVYSGGVYNFGAGKMAQDGSNINNLKNDAAAVSNVVYANSITKDAGDNQTVTLSINLLNNSFDKWNETVFKSRIGDTVYYSNNGSDINLIIDSVTVGSSAISVAAHLKVDDSAAISLGVTSIYLSNYIKSGSSYASAIGRGNSADGLAAKANGYVNAAMGQTAVAEGTQCVAANDYSHAEGFASAATGSAAHAEGQNTIASGNYSHAEGSYSEATGIKSHASGDHTKVGYDSQFAVGYYNNNKSGTIFEVGAGSSGTRKNAFEVYSNGAISCNDGTDKFKFAKSSGKPGYYDSSNTFHKFEEPVYLSKSVSLSTSGDVTVTFTNANILETSLINYYTTEFGTVPKDVVVTSGGGSCTVTFGKVQSAHSITCVLEVKNI